MHALNDLQKEVHEWKKRNFPRSGEIHQFLGVVEEVGELSHAVLKAQQGIRGDNHIDEIKDAVGDIMIYLMNFCSENGWSLSDLVLKAWEEVSARDWLTYQRNGRDE